MAAVPADEARWRCVFLSAALNSLSSTASRGSRALRYPGRFGLMFRCGLPKDESLERSAHAAFMALENALRALYAVPLSKPLAPEQWNAPVVRATARSWQNLGGAPAPQPAVMAARGIDACLALEENGRILASLFVGRWHGQGRAGCVPPFEPAAPWVALGIAGCGHHRQAAAYPLRRLFQAGVAVLCDVEHAVVSASLAYTATVFVDRQPLVTSMSKAFAYRD